MYKWIFSGLLNFVIGKNDAVIFQIDEMHSEQ